MASLPSLILYPPSPRPPRPQTSLVHSTGNQQPQTVSISDNTSTFWPVPWWTTPMAYSLTHPQLPPPMTHVQHRIRLRIPLRNLAQCLAHCQLQILDGWINEGLNRRGRQSCQGQGPQGQGPQGRKAPFRMLKHGWSRPQVEDALACRWATQTTFQCLSTYHLCCLFNGRNMK